MLFFYCSLSFFPRLDLPFQFKDLSIPVSHCLFRILSELFFFPIISTQFFRASKYAYAVFLHLLHIYSFLTFNFAQSIKTHTVGFVVCRLTNNCGNSNLISVYAVFFSFTCLSCSYHFLFHLLSHTIIFEFLDHCFEALFYKDNCCINIFLIH